MADNSTQTGNDTIATDEQTIGGVAAKVQMMLPWGGALLDGTLAATTTAGALGGSADCAGMMIQADPDNTADVFIGDSTNQRYQLTPGQSITLLVNNTNKPYGKAASGTQSINWLAVQKGS